MTEQIEGFMAIRSHGSIYVPSDLDEMVAKSDLIVIGKPQQSIAESTALIKRGSDGYITEAISDTKFKVSRVLKGAVDSEVISIGQQAAIVKDEGDAAYSMRLVEDYQPLVKNAKYILFLRKGLDGSSLYFPTGVYYGKVNTDGADEGEKKTRLSKDHEAIRGEVFGRFKKEILEAAE
ncbi:hypothetical protein [Phormidesmis priestleyi]